MSFFLQILSDRHTSYKMGGKLRSEFLFVNFGLHVKHMAYGLVMSINIFAFICLPQCFLSVWSPEHRAWCGSLSQHLLCWFEHNLIDNMLWMKWGGGGSGVALYVTYKVSSWLSTFNWFIVSLYCRTKSLSRSQGHRLSCQLKRFHDFELLRYEKWRLYVRHSYFTVFQEPQCVRICGIFMPPFEEGGAYCFAQVRRSVRPSVCRSVCRSPLTLCNW